MRRGRLALSPAQSVWWAVCALASLLWLVLLIALLHDRHTALIHNLFPGGPVFDDLITYRTRIPLLGTPAFYVPHVVPPTFAYPPAAAYLFALIYKLPHDHFLFLVLCAGSAVLFSYTLFVLLASSVATPRRRAGLAASLLLLSYPIIFTAERGNLEIVICLLVFAGIFAAWRGQLLTAAVLLGLAASIKPFPVLLFGIFLARRIAWRPLLLAIATAAITTLICIWRAGPDLVRGALGFYRGLANIEHSRAGTSYHGGLMFDHSFFSPVKAVALVLHLEVRPLLEAYYVAVAILLLWGAWRVSRFPLLNRICFYSVAAVAAAPISYEYTVVECYPLLLLIVAGFFAVERSERLGRLELGTLTCTLLLFLPFTLYGNGRFAVGGQIEALLFFVLMLCSTVRPWQSIGLQSVERRGTAPFFAAQPSEATQLETAT